MRQHAAFYLFSICVEYIHTEFSRQWIAATFQLCKVHVFCNSTSKLPLYERIARAEADEYSDA